MIRVYYRAPYTARLYVHDIAPEHVAAFQDRLHYGAFSPRHLYAARPDVWRLVPIEAEPADAPLNVHEWTYQEETR